jgi:hypothetical protein
MAKSTLAKLTVPAHPNNYAQGRSGYKICKFTPHHMAGILTAEQCGKIFQNPTRKASSNYGIGNDGTIACYVEEENRAYTSSSKSNDCQAITVEVSNCEIGGEWKISDAAWNSLVALAVDVCQRYNFRLEYDGTKNGSLTRHNMFAATSCPGPYLQNRFSELAETVNKILDGEQSRPTVVPTPEPTNKKVGDIVTINGVYTASNSTKKLKPARNTGTITKIVNGALNPYLLDNGNLGWVNDSVIIEQKNEPTPAPVQPTKLSTNELADAIQAGKYGNGAERFNKLKAEGYTDAEINAAQDEVNRRYGAKPTTSNKPVEIRNGDKVQIKSNATHYVTGQAIPSWVKNKTYTVMQKGEGKSLLREIMSWVYDRDLTK